MNREQMIEKAAAAVNHFDDSQRIARAVVDVLLPQVTTVEELEALPDGSYAVGSDGEAWRRVGIPGREWWIGDYAHYDTASLLAEFGPLTVVWQP